ncbi:uncharacterized [Tachysurus ichikawai]
MDFPEGQYIKKNLFHTEHSSCFSNPARVSLSARSSDKMSLERCTALKADVTAFPSSHTAAAEKEITVSVNIAARVCKKRDAFFQVKRRIEFKATFLQSF